MGGIQTNIFGAFDCQGLMLFFFFEHCGTLHSKYTNNWQKLIALVKYVERYSLQLQTCATISSSPRGEIINWPQLVLIVATIEKARDGAHWSNMWANKNIFLMLFSWTFFLCGVTFWASLRCGKAYGSSKLLLQLNFFTICSLSALARLLPSACFWFPSAHTAPETAKSVESSAQNLDKMEA